MSWEGYDSNIHVLKLLFLTRYKNLLLQYSRHFLRMSKLVTDDEYRSKFEYFLIYAESCIRSFYDNELEKDIKVISKIASCRRTYILPYDNKTVMRRLSRV
eukprot:TRINITY_DN2783_c0_g1_i4.p1 TRINITY_DN2783_c0_g1~~TRINITY_DN2783_c0_g1_i4.p1  ORF type:complete len:101 (+),score=7.92 TRINITY_DN2783_c0_g1_i4:672-974(+)